MALGLDDHGSTARRRRGGVGCLTSTTRTCGRRAGRFYLPAGLLFAADVSMARSFNNRILAEAAAL